MILGNSLRQHIYLALRLPLGYVRLQGSCGGIDARVSSNHMNYGIVLERIENEGFPPGYYYAHIPSLGLTTHGLGIEGAREAARDLLQQWISEKRANQEPVPTPAEFLFSTVEISEDALQGA